ncbi:exodeoxyribonuclease VII large subunit [Gorillibacterium massiliense]|uniref:exodeoxyribonuclease VII large subunit n=1 Tax=Gorillibacterium massiliense TaxID=1280390 RepID=UPI0004BA83E6|nr:exodeoxyribonuclease VII large subunit [Gorillibacterium massiliense]
MPDPMYQPDNGIEQDNVLSIKDLNRLIKRKLEGEPLFQDVWVRGEISNFTHHGSGHMYFTLKDAESRLKSIMFASYNQRLPFIPKEGTRVLARGSVSVYERDGQYQFYVTQMQPDGIGSLYLAFEQLKMKLEREGLFSAERKKPIPRLPKTVGVITSPTGAAVRDILITLQRRYPSVNIILYPVLVQGKGAAPSIVKAVEAMNERQEADVLIVGRGGGSLEELWAFNEEIVARSIFASRIPVISAVGHETDFTIADFVADIRAATPTAAAELAVPHHLELKQKLHYESGQLQRALMKRLADNRKRLDILLRSQALSNPRRQLREPVQQLDRLRELLGYRMHARLTQEKHRMSKLKQSVIAHHPGEQADFARKRLASMNKQLLSAMRVKQQASKSGFQSAVRQLDALSPLKVMSRGYSLVFDEKEKKLVRSINTVQLGDIVKIQLSDGKLTAHVWSMEESNNGQGN